MSKSHYPRLTDRLLALSESDDYEEAKHEWRITGRVWRLDGRKTYDNSDGIPTQVRYYNRRNDRSMERRNSSRFS